MSLAAKIAFLFFASLLSAHAGDFSDAMPFKVLGRGVQNKETKELLQLACVGPEVNGERSCDDLQFLHIDATGRAQLIGSIITLPRTEEAQRLRSVIRERFKEDIREMNRSRKKPLQKFAEFWDRLHDQEKLIVGGVLALGIGCVSNGASPLIVGGAIAIWAAPLTIHLVSAPFDSARRVLKGSFILQRGLIASGDALQSRTLQLWQFRAKPVGPERFEEIYEVLSRPSPQTCACLEEGDQEG